MVCPECGSEYREGFVNCADCGAPLVESRPEEPGEPDVEIVKVYTSTNAATLPLAESVLHDAEIEFMIKSEGLQDLFALGRFGLGSNSLIGPATIWVRKDNEAEARELLAKIDEPVELNVQESSEEE